MKEDQENKDPPKRSGRTNIGEVRGKEQRTRSFSMRASTGGIEVIKKHCPFCNHHKAIKNIMGKSKCSRCKK